MMQSTVLRLVIIVSCAHALVHLYELALPSVEQEIAHEFSPDDSDAGKRLSGNLSNYWRLMWGLGALAAGWFVDRLGGRSMLAIYLFGCGVSCLIASASNSTNSLATSMLVMGAFASIYHPAGLALIARETSPENRPRALGIHGIFGSIGIGVGPLIAWGIAQAGGSWRQFFGFIALPGCALALVFVSMAFRDRQKTGDASTTRKHSPLDERAHWVAFCVLTILAFLQGFVYAAQMSFLPRYLSSEEQIVASSPDESLPTQNDSGEGADDRDLRESTESPDSTNDAEQSLSSPNENGAQGKLLASIALLCGCIGQYLAGRFAKHDRLEWQITLITLFNVPFLVWMAVASDWARPVAACLFALVHFMHQPIYNSLIPKYAPRKRLSMCYGVSISIGLGCGSFGARFAGAFVDDWTVYGSLALFSLLAAGVGGVLIWLNFRVMANEKPQSD